MPLTCVDLRRGAARDVRLDHLLPGSRVLLLHQGACAARGRGALAVGAASDVASRAALPAELDAVEQLFDALAGGSESISRQQLVEGLTRMGYRASSGEWVTLLDEMDVRGGGTVGRADFLAAVADWRRVAATDEPRWNEWVDAAYHAFGGDDASEGVSSQRLLSEVCDVDWEQLGGSVCRSAVENALKEVADAQHGLVSREAWGQLLAVACSAEPLEEFDLRC